MSSRLCTWQSDEDSNWDTKCEQTFIFLDGGPVDNWFEFCPYCGGSLVEAKRVVNRNLIKDGDK